MPWGARKRRVRQRRDDLADFPEVSTGLIGSAMFVRASSSVTGNSTARPSTNGRIAGCLCSGVR